MASLDYYNFDLTFEATADGYTVRVTDSPAGQAVAPFAFPFEALEFENFLLRLGQRSGGTRRADSPEIELSKQFGGRLFDAIFDDDVRAALRSSVRAAEDEAAGLRIRLRFGNAPELADVPWEFLYDAGANRFLTLSRETPLVRYLDLTRPVEPLLVETPLRILVMISDPSDYERLDVEGEWERLTSALADLQRRGLVEIVRLDKATLLELQRMLRERQFHIFHYIGHGVFDESADDGFLVLEDESGRGRKVSGQYVGTLLADHRSLRLAVLNSCEGGRSSRQDPYAGAAQSLVQQGLPAVAAMQFEISDDSAAVFAQEFYMALADGYPVDAALAEGRRAIFATKTNAEWGFPVLFMRAADGRIFDVQAPAPSPPPAQPLPVEPPTVAETSVTPSPAPEPKSVPESGPTVTVQGTEAGTVQVGADVAWEKRVEPAGSTPNDLRMVKIIGGVILGAFVVMALLFYLIFRNSTEQATPTALAAPTIKLFEAEPEKVVAGEQQKVQLVWRISGDMTGVALSGPDIDPSLALSRTGSLLVDVSGPASFTLTTNNLDQSDSRQVTVSAIAPTATPAAGGSAPVQEITVTFESVRIIDDCDNILTGLGEFWLELTVNDERLRWPETGTNEVDSGQSYAIGQALTTRVAEGDSLIITGAGFEVDEFQTESMGSIRVSHNAGDGWGVGSGSQESLAVCKFVLRYTIEASPVTASSARTPAADDPNAMPYWASDEGLARDPNNFGYTMAGDEYRGDSQAPVTVIEFADMQDPYGQRHHMETQAALDSEFVNQVKIRWVFKHFPLETFPQSYAAAIALECAANQQQFWRMHDILRADIDRWSVDPPNPVFLQIAEEIGLGEAAYSACLENENIAALVEQDLEDGASIVQGVPTFVVIANGEGQLIPGALPAEQFVEILKSVLAELE